MIEDEIVGWHHQLNGHEFEQAPGVGDGQGSLMCCSPWVSKSQKWLSNWIELLIPGLELKIDIISSNCICKSCTHTHTHTQRLRLSFWTLKKLRLEQCDYFSLHSIFLIWHRIIVLLLFLLCFIGSKCFFLKWLNTCMTENISDFLFWQGTRKIQNNAIFFP